jgi:hypothetical protein
LKKKINGKKDVDGRENALETKKIGVTNLILKTQILQAPINIGVSPCPITPLQICDVGAP